MRVINPGNPSCCYHTNVPSNARVRHDASPLTFPPTPLNQPPVPLTHDGLADHDVPPALNLDPTALPRSDHLVLHFMRPSARVRYRLMAAKVLLPMARNSATAATL